MTRTTSELYGRLTSQMDRHVANRITELVRALQLTPQDQKEETIAQIHDFSARIDYIQDYDFGAVIMEEMADSIEEIGLKILLYRHAEYRSRWCIQSASAGGEAIARSVHWNRIKKKFEQVSAGNRGQAPLR